ncbi:MAG: hypothetical protein VBE63_21430 [Lamprobacter sp.]|uniref:hypothetical protein n=1 Tax=Lamprobacter sp. TaxID=3100796 RepID=UPI002B25CBFB|nr:hypothetical protein [Lamprobacter sp.]MEA3642483.1 hypothetical protein [Lamprobacter sp.]
MAFGDRFRQAWDNSWSAAKAARKAVATSFVNVAKSACTIACRAVTRVAKHATDCFGKAIRAQRGAKPTEVADAVRSGSVKSAVKEVIDPERVKGYAAAAGRKTGRGRASALANMLDDRAPPAIPGRQAKKLFDGRRSLRNSFLDATKRLKKELGKDGMGAAAKKAAAKSLRDGVKPRALGLSAIIEVGAKVYEKGFDWSKYEKKDLIDVGYGVGSGVAYGALGAAVGTLIPVPIVGTAVGFLVGTAVGMVVDNLIKDGTVEFLDCLTG